MTNSKKQFLWVLTLLMAMQMTTKAQVKVGNEPTALNPNAVLEIQSTNKGVLLPRLNLVNTKNPSPLTKHEAGMILYNTATVEDVVPGFYYNNGIKWISLNLPQVGDYTTDMITESADKRYQTDDQFIFNDATASIQGQLDNKANINSPTFTGIPTVPTLDPSAAALQITNKEYVDTAVANASSAIITQTITNGVLDKAPSEDAVKKELDLKATLADLNTEISNRTNANNTLQEQVDNKANINSPTFTGSPTVPTLNSGDIPLRVANKGYVDTAIANVSSSIITQTITAGVLDKAPAEDAVRKELDLKATVADLNTEITNRVNTDTDLQGQVNNMVNQTDLAQEITNRTTADTTLQSNIDLKTDKINGISQITDANSVNNSNINAGPNATQAIINSSIDIRLSEKAPKHNPIFTGTAQVPDITANAIANPLAIANKGYVDTEIVSSSQRTSIYLADGTLSADRVVSLDGKTIAFKTTNNKSFTVDASGNTSIGYTTTPMGGNALDVNGNTNIEGTLTADRNMIVNNPSVTAAATEIGGIRFNNEVNGDLSALQH